MLRLIAPVVAACGCGVVNKTKKNTETMNYQKSFRHLAAAVVAAFLAALVPSQAQAQLPSLKLKNIDGATVDIATLGNDGKPFIIDFFATWCKPCNRELSAINDVYDEWQEETGVKVIAVSIDKAQNTNKVKPLVSQYGWEYEVLLDPNSDFLRALGGTMIPYVVVVDGDGNIVSKHSGYTEGAEEELIEQVRQLIK